MQREDTRARMIAAFKPSRAWDGKFGWITCPCPCCRAEALHINVDRARSDEHPDYLFDVARSCRCELDAITEKLSAAQEKPSAADRGFLKGFMLGHLIGEAAAAQERIEKFQQYADELLRKADAAINDARRGGSACRAHVSRL